ncbi:MAG: biopolymer transporter ExbD [Longimicrobiales bacterium]
MSLGTRRRRRGRDDLPLNADINVTSLVDVAFTLLVIFIITAPILQGGIEVAVPRADVQPLTAQDEPFFVTIDADGRVFISESEVSMDEFQSTLTQLAEAGTFEQVYIRGDSLADYGPVLKVIAATATASLRFALVGEPYTGR